ncbi:hypothetical protein [Psychrobacter sp. JCM 18900]|uniref:hypothetical protein n=1 Tax=Psychrobacter sp. JCM 18900 TaxID=1298608 RepID=UPI0021C4A2E4|nr:hypothetical protein [Psychrobacter sp. JCM 18900]
MEDILLEFENGIADILELFNKFRDSIGENPVSKTTRDRIDYFIRAYENYKVALDKGSAEKIAEAALSVCSNASTIDFLVEDIDERTREYSKTLSERAVFLRGKIENSPILTVPLTDKARSNVSSDMQDYRSFKKQLKDTNEKLEQLNRKVKKIT